jgi:citrate lyase subunit beta/citryl-CoA lyase
MTGVADAVTWLFVPGHRADRFAKAAAAGADVVIFDLQDAVPAEQKAEARVAVAEALASGALASGALASGALAAGATGCVRINPVTGADGQADLEALRGVLVGAAPGEFSVMLPLAESAADLDRIQAHLPGIAVVALIESARGWAAARELSAHPVVTRLAFGNLDTAADLGCSPDSPTLDQVRMALVLESRLAGLAGPVDGVTTEFRDPRVAGADAGAAKRFGMAGKLCIHPAQLVPVAEAFAPTEAEIAWAREIESGLAAAGGGAFAVDGAMVDAPVIARARRILRSAEGELSR